MDDVQLANYIAGTHTGPVEAWRTGSVSSLHLLVPEQTIVWISDYNLTKTRIVHPEVDFQDYLQLPEILAKGFATPGNKKRCVEFCHVELDTSKNRFWSVSIKATKTDEVYLTMLRRGNFLDIRRRYRRAVRHQKLLRDHQNAKVRRLLGRT